MLNKVVSLKQKAENKLAKLAPIATYGIIVANYLSREMVYAEAGAEDLMKLIVKIIANLIIILGALLAIMGIIHFASAQSEGDGPAKTKAIGQIAAGVMLAVLSMILKSNADTFASYVSTTL